MNEKQVKALLVGNNIVPESAEVTRITEATFRVHNAERRPDLAVKAVHADTPRGTHGIREAHRRAGALADFVQTVLCIIPTGEGVLAVLNWIDGTTLRDTRRHLLPGFFSELRRWHESNRGIDGFYSPYSRQSTASIPAFINAEIDIHARNAGLLNERSQLAAQLAGLTNGFPTLIHGDVHPGNIMVSDNRFVLLDPEYVHPGINLLDLDYINMAPAASDSRDWWAITKLAKPCVDAYFRGQDIEYSEIARIMHSVRILTLLRSVTNALLYSTGTAAEAVIQLKQALTRSDTIH